MSDKILALIFICEQVLLILIKNIRFFSRKNWISTEMQIYFFHFSLCQCASKFHKHLKLDGLLSFFSSFHFMHSSEPKHVIFFVEIFVFWHFYFHFHSHRKFSMYPQACAITFSIYFSPFFLFCLSFLLCLFILITFLLISLSVYLVNSDFLHSISFTAFYFVTQ